MKYLIATLAATAALAVSAAPATAGAASTDREAHCGPARCI